MRDRSGVRELLDQADRAAILVGADQQHYGSTFGPVAVDLTRVLTALDLGDHANALALHRKIIATHAFLRLPAERRAAHLVDVARHCVRLGEPAEQFDT
ncbi:hypothetical protein ACQSSU_21190 [Micromonospora echinospora]